MADDTSPQQPKKRRGAGRPFQPGQSGNPKGRPLGARNRVSALAQQLMEADAEPVVTALLQAAKQGDIAAVRLVLERVAPVSRSRPVYLDLPPIENASGVGMAMSAVLQAVANGDLAPDEAAAIASLIEVRRRSIELEELGARLAALERKETS